MRPFRPVAGIQGSCGITFRYGNWLLSALVAVSGSAVAQSLDAVREDQIARLRNYVVDAMLPSGLVRDSLVLDPSESHFHPATPDAAGFALVALSALDHVGSIADAEQRVETILRAHAGLMPGVSPSRSADGHFVHFMNISSGAPAGGGWDASYSPISSALLVAGAQFASRHFSANTTIAALSTQLTQSVDFNAAIHPDLNGRVFLDMTQQGGGGGGAVSAWNEFMLVESLALRQSQNDRAIAVRHRWLNPDNILQRSFEGIPTLTDNFSAFAPAFWVHQMHFFNGDFSHNPEFEQFFQNQQFADRAYSQSVLGETFRYGLTAGVSPGGYHADAIGNHPGNVFSPEAVAAWGDMNTLLAFFNEQPPASDPRYRYGMVRVSQSQSDWIPYDAGLVDHLFLLFGLVESIDPDFFRERALQPLLPGDYNGDGHVDAADYVVWRDTNGSRSQLLADGDLSGIVGPGDYSLWRAHFGDASGASSHLPPVVVVPEPNAFVVLFTLVLLAPTNRRRQPVGADVSLNRRLSSK